MRFAAALCFVLGAATASAAADPPAALSDHGLGGPLVSQNAEAAALQDIAPAAGSAQIQEAIEKCRDETAGAMQVSSDVAELRCAERLLGP